MARSLPRRPRITTRRPRTPSPRSGVAVAFRGDRGSRLVGAPSAGIRLDVAVAFRGDRGSQPRCGPGPRQARDRGGRLPDRGSQRRRDPRRGLIVGVAVAIRDDRGSQHARCQGRGGGGNVAFTFRDDRGSQRIRRLRLLDVLRRGGRLPTRPRIATTTRPSSKLTVRSAGRPSGATEDLNHRSDSQVVRPTVVAVAVRGDRGSQHRRRREARPLPARGGHLPRRPRIATTTTEWTHTAESGGGRLPRGPKGATAFGATAPDMPTSTHGTC